MTFDDISRQRMDYSVGPSGETIATLTITLGDGSTHRYSASTDDEEIDEVASAFAATELKQRKIEGESFTENEIAGVFSFFKKAVRAVGNVAKKIASSKVFKYAAKGLALVAPVLGPFAGPALAVSGAMGVASKLASAGVAAAAGAKKAARALMRGAKKLAAKKVKSRKARRALMRIANKKRKAASRLADKPSRRRRRRRPMRRARPVRRRPTRQARPVRRRPTRRPRRRTVRKPNLLVAARAGRLRSNKRGAVTARSLAKAARRGRVYWIAA